ncbi:MAG: hypothetical protein DPW18_13055 [Chloroflexi bacterium]|nr:hypothetical protein [Chloroflexota bacterium]MDL1940966.1 response regulator [Chloroflexi bacterium CFX2]
MCSKPRSKNRASAPRRAGTPCENLRRKRQRSGRMSKRKVLLAEDDITMVSLLKTLLKMEGYDVVALQADEDIVSAVKKEKPDVLLMDVFLNHQSGLDVLEELRSSAETSRLRVVMSSGASVRDECIRRGADGFLAKPYMPDDLIDILKQTINV